MKHVLYMALLNIGFFSINIHCGPKQPPQPQSAKYVQQPVALPVPTEVSRYPAEETGMSEQDRLDKEYAETLIKLSRLQAQGANPTAFLGVLTPEERASMPQQPINNQEEEQKTALLNRILSATTWHDETFRRILSRDVNLLSRYNDQTKLKILDKILYLPTKMVRNFRIHGDETLEPATLHEIYGENGILDRALQQIITPSNHQAIDDSFGHLSSFLTDRMAYFRNSYKNFLQSSLLLKHKLPQSVHNKSMMNSINITLNKYLENLIQSYCATDNVINDDYYLAEISKLLKNKHFKINEPFRDERQPFLPFVIDQINFYRGKEMDQPTKNIQRLKPLINLTIDNGANPYLPSGIKNLTTLEYAKTLKNIPSELITAMDQAFQKRNLAMYSSTSNPKERLNVPVSDTLRKLLGS